MLRAHLGDPSDSPARPYHRIATAVQALFSIALTIAVPYILAPNEADGKGKAGYLFAGSSAICPAWCCFCLPKLRERSFEEINILFEKEISARESADYGLTREVENAQGKVGSVSDP